MLGPGGVFSDNGLTGATFQMVNHGVVSLAAFLLIGLVELRTGTDALKSLGGLANRRPVASTVFLLTALFALAVPGSSVFISELYILIGAFAGAAAAGRRRLARDRAGRHVHAALVLGDRARG